MKQTIRKLFGFRSGKPVKMIAALAWYLLCLVVLFFGLTTPVPVAASAYDAGLYRLSGVILFLWMLSPAVFLSNTPLRQYLPLFRKRQTGFSVMGMMIVFVFFAYLFASVESLHSPAYQEAFNTYIQSAYQAFVDAGTRAPY